MSSGSQTDADDVAGGAVPEEPCEREVGPPGGPSLQKGQYMMFQFQAVTRVMTGLCYDAYV